MNNIWFFGDCFTWGYGCHPKDPYYAYKTENDEIWTTLVAKKLDYLEKKPYYGYGAMDYIINLWISNLKNIKKNDIVIVSDTVPDGILCVVDNKVDSINALSWKNADIDNFSNKDNLLNYIFTEKKPFREIWSKFYYTQIQNIAIELLNRDVKSFFWSHQLYKKHKKFERINDATNNKIDDIHFSWQGHRQMADYILTKIQNDDYIRPKLI